jgi:hypothetical protein
MAPPAFGERIVKLLVSNTGWQAITVICAKRNVNWPDCSVNKAVAG